LRPQCTPSIWGEQEKSRDCMKHVVPHRGGKGSSLSTSFLCRKKKKGGGPDEWLTVLSMRKKTTGATRGTVEVRRDGTVFKVPYPAVNLPVKESGRVSRSQCATHGEGRGSKNASRRDHRPPLIVTVEGIWKLKKEDR